MTDFLPMDYIWALVDLVVYGVATGLAFCILVGSLVAIGGALMLVVAYILSFVDEGVE